MDNVSSSKMVDSLSSVIDLQLLAIEKALISINTFLDAGINEDIRKLISSVGLNIQNLISKAQKQVSFLFCSRMLGTIPNLKLFIVRVLHDNS